MDSIKFIYRAVSDAELTDLKAHGIRNKPGAFEFGKLFALSFEDALAYGKIISSFDHLSVSIVKIAISQELFDKSEFIEADGMDAVLIEKEYLNLLLYIER